ncbi:MAG: hypothetical protein ACRC4M_04500 [Mycoplasma sp.]
MSQVKLMQQTQIQTKPVQKPFGTDFPEVERTRPALAAQTPVQQPRVATMPAVTPMPTAKPVSTFAPKPQVQPQPTTVQQSQNQQNPVAQQNVQQEVVVQHEPQLLNIYDKLFAVLESSFEQNDIGNISADEVSGEQITTLSDKLSIRKLELKAYEKSVRNWSYEFGAKKPVPPRPASTGGFGSKPAMGQPQRPGMGGQPQRPGMGAQPQRPGMGQPQRPGMGGQPQRPGMPGVRR